MPTVVPSMPGNFSLTVSHQPLSAGAGPAGAAPAEVSAPLPADDSAALLSAALLAVVVVVLDEPLLHAVSTNATALIPAIVAANFFAGL